MARGRRRKGQPPAYLLHEASGLAYVTLHGEQVYLGKHGSPESLSKYRRIVRDFEDASLKGLPVPPAGCAVWELVEVHQLHARQYYRRPDGTPTGEAGEFRRACDPLLADFADLAVDEFRPRDLKAVRVKMVEAGLSLGVINQRVGRIRRVFRWGVSEDIVQASTVLALESVPDLSPGRGQARETEDVPPVPWWVVDATLPFLASDQLRCLVAVQRHTGCRPGEACLIRAADIHKTGTFRVGRSVYCVPEGCWVWVVRAKMAHSRESVHQFYVVPPKLQAVLSPWMEGRDPEAYLFSPAEARAALYAERRKNRKTKVQPSQESRASAAPKRQPGQRYTASSYAHAVEDAVLFANVARACQACRARTKEGRCAKCGRVGERGMKSLVNSCASCRRRWLESRCDDCKSASVPHWHPHQLRHSVEVEAEKLGGADAGRAVLGHTDLKTAARYGQRDIDLAADVLRRL